MRKDKWFLGIGIAIIAIGLLSSLMTGCSTMANLFGPNKEDRVERREYPVDTITRIKEFGYEDFLEQARKSQWDSVSIVDFGQPFVISYPSTLADSIIEYAKLFIGKPYVSAGKGPNNFDCSGFTSFVFRHFGYELKATTTGQLNDGWKVIRKQDELRTGDLVFYGGRKKTREIGHVAIVVSNDVVNHRFTFIHATVKLGVTISTSTESYYAPRYITACRILPE